MNLTVFAGILLAVTMATARRASLGEKTMQAAGKADKPEEAMREPASLVEKIMRAADEADEPAGAKRANEAQECYTGNGDAYRGNISITESGKLCQNWNSQIPHTHESTPDNRPNTGLVANYCRLGGWTEGLRPWCYTMEEDTRWEYCNVPECPGMKYQIIHERKTWTEAKDDCEARGAKLAMLETKAEAREAGKLIKELEKLISDSGVYWVEKYLGDFYFGRYTGRRPTFGYMSGVLKGSLQSSGNRLNFICQKNRGDDGCWKWPSTCEKKNHKCCKGGCDERPNDRGNKAMRCGW